MMNQLIDWLSEYSELVRGILFVVAVAILVLLVTEFVMVFAPDKMNVWAAFWLGLVLGHSLKR